MRFLRTNGGVVSIDASPLDELMSFRQVDNSTPESGGMILGRIILDSDDVVVDNITWPDNKDKKSRFSFFRRRKSAQARVDAAWATSKGTCIYLGEWHTHPESVPTPSSTTDIPNWAAIVKHAKYEQDFLLFLIVGIARSNMWEICRKSSRITQLKHIDSQIIA